MRKSDTQLGIPYTDFTDTKANIEAIAAPVEGMRAFATDTKLSGFYNGTIWVWGAAVGDHALLTNLQGGTASEYYHLTSAEYTGTGTGNFVRTTSPTLVTPVLGVATATSVMGLTTAQVTDLTDGGATTLHSHAGGGGNGTFQRVISADLTFATGECLVLTGYLDLVTYSLTLDGDAQLEVL